MSYGDEIMASGQAFTEYRRVGERVRIADAVGNPRWHDLWDGLPWIKRPEEPVEPGEATIRNGPKCRPYISYPFSRATGCRYSGWRARDNVGAIVFRDDEIEFAASVAKHFGKVPAVMIEPHVPIKSNPNKQWGWKRWCELVEMTPMVRWIQVGPHGTQAIPGVPLIVTPTFRAGAAVLAQCQAAVLPEGGLHHAAGVLKIPAVVLFGGAVDVNATGYPWHDNVGDPRGEPACGAWTPCDHCALVWKTITPYWVAGRLAALLQRKKAAA